MEQPELWGRLKEKLKVDQDGAGTAYGTTVISWGLMG